MSQIVTIENALNAAIATALPDYVMLSDAYDTADNVNINLNKGYSTAFGSGKKVTNDFCPGSVDIEREIIVALTNIYLPNFDSSYRQGLEQSFMNDHFSLVSAIESNPTLSQTCAIASYQEDSGIEYLENDSKQFIAIFTTITVRYIEGVN